MKITHTYTWAQHGVIPPRCRKPRTLLHEGQAYTVEVPEVTGTDAPVAFRVYESLAKRWEELRWYGGQLWTRHLPWSRQTEDTIAGTDRFPAQVGHERWQSYDSPQHAETMFRAWAEDFLIVDGVVHTTANEPIYEVSVYRGGRFTPGGGVYISVEHGIPTTREPIARASHWFTADHFEDARKAAIAVAERGGHLSSAENLKAMEPTIQVLVPEAVTLRLPRTFRVVVERTFTVRKTLWLDADGQDAAAQAALADDDGADSLSGEVMSRWGDIVSCDEATLLGADEEG